MALEQKLSLRLAQKLVMTPSLQQAIKLLQMTRLELEGVLTQELVENPVLEEQDLSFDDDPRLAVETPVAEETKSTELEKALADIDLDAYFGDSESWEGKGQSSVFEEREGPPLENTLTHEEDLYDHLLWQLQMSGALPSIREIAELIIGNLEPDGYLCASIEEIQAMGQNAERDSYARDQVEEALELIRSFDPPGIACEDLQQCLLRQLDFLGQPVDSIARRVIAEKWDLFTHRKFDAIARDLGISLQELKPSIEIIAKLDTRPGRKFLTDRTHYVEPDVYVIKVGDEYIIQLNDNGMPRLRVSRSYRRMLQTMRQSSSETEAQNYIKDKMRSALWLIKSLDQRQRTIYKVTQSIVTQQRAFLDHGVAQLRPMVLRDVAEDIGMHESTVSRVVSNKYVHTPRGLLPMKFFFHSGIDREYGGDISSLSVKQKIKQLVQDENPDRPLSDSELMRILQREGIQIARRTVAKYRDELAIASSADRKRIF